MKDISQKLKAKSLKLKANRSTFHVLRSFITQNYFLLIFVGCIGFVGVVSLYKLFVVKPTYIYAKVKVGQGMWWATTQKPSLWFVRAIQSAKEQNDLSGRPIVKIIDVSYYPSYASGPYVGQYDVYVTAQLKVSSVGKKGTYTFNRETIGVSTPIDLEFPNVQFSGTVIDLSEKPFVEKLVEKTIYVSKRIPFPWEFDQIQVGDKQSNGKQTVFEIIDKTWGDGTDTTFIQQGTLVNAQLNLFVIKAKIKVKQVGDQYIFGEEAVIAPGKVLSAVGTSKFTFADYYILKVE